MWNVRNVLRSLSYRLKSSTNGCAHGTKEGRELEDEYKHLWASGFCTGDYFRQNPVVHRKNGLLPASVSTRHNGAGGNSKGQDSQRENHTEWDPLRFPFTRSWIEALGWGAALGLGLNVLHMRQDELLRRRCPLETLTATLDGKLPAWTRELYALSMPLRTPSPLIKAVLPRAYGSSEGLVVTEEEEMSGTTEEEFSRSSLDDFSDTKQIRYTSETSALMSVMRQQLTSVARDYVSEMQALLGRAQDALLTEKDQDAQEEFNLGLFYELGIGVQKNHDKALEHYMQAAALEHPLAIENVISLHTFTTATPELGVRRSSSSPVLTTAVSQTSDYGEECDSESDGEGSPRGKFWQADTDSGASFSRSRSNSLPDGTHPVRWQVGGK